MEPTQNNQTELGESGANMESPERRRTQWGPAVAAVVIVALIILGGLYLWSVNRGGLPEESGTDTDASAGDPVVEQLEEQSPSDAVSDIETDLEATDLENIDQEFDNIEREFGI